MAILWWPGNIMIAVRMGMSTPMPMESSKITRSRGVIFDNDRMFTALLNVHWRITLSVDFITVNMILFSVINDAYDVISIHAEIT